MQLQSIIEQYKPLFIEKYGNRLLPGQRQAIHAMQRCRTPDSGEFYVQCTQCVYRGVISEKNILSNRNGQVAFSHTNSDTGKTKTRTLKSEAFLHLILQHVLPRGFRRVRDYGFLLRIFTNYEHIILPSVNTKFYQL